MQHGNLVGLHGVTHFQMVNAFPIGSTATIPEIAQKSGVHPDDAKTLIDHALTFRYFERQPDGSITHSASTRAIITIPHVQAWITHALNNMWRDVPYIVPAMAKWPGSQEPYETAFNFSRRVDGPFFKEVGKNPQDVQAFMNAMRFFLDKPNMSPNFAIQGYSWEAHAEGTIVDVGGSHGLIAFKLAERYPGMTLVVQDLPEVVAKAPSSGTRQVVFQAHNFLEEQPVKEADIYFLRYILHSWADKYCIAILRALIPALKAGSRILLMEHIVPEAGDISLFQERQIRRFDLAMKQNFNSKERTEKAWRQVLRDADERFNVVEIRTPEGSQLSIIVVEWAPDRG